MAGQIPKLMRRMHKAKQLREAKKFRDARHKRRKKLDDSVFDFYHANKELRKKYQEMVEKVSNGVPLDPEEYELYQGFRRMLGRKKTQLRKIKRHVKGAVGAGAAVYGAKKVYDHVQDEKKTKFMKRKKKK